MTDKADIVIIGGGIIGTSIAYYLARLGVKRVVLLEKGYLAGGSTGRCGGGIRQQWSEPMNVRLAMRSVELFEHFDEEPGMDIEYYKGGYLLLAYNEEEERLFERNVAMQQREGLDVRLLTPAETKRLFPFMNLQGLKLAAHCPDDGHANPHLATFAYARAAENLGVRILTRTEARSIEIRNGCITAVETDRGRIETSVVINAAGGYSREVGQLAGVEIPTESYRHQIFVTEPVEAVLDPLVISFLHNFYIRQTKAGNFIMGQGDRDEKPGFNLNTTWKFLKEMTGKMPDFFPFLEGIRVLRHWAGLYNMSPDAQPIIDRSQEISDYYFAVGFSGHGFMLAPAVGEAVAEWIVYGKPEKVDILNLRLSRFAHGVSIEKNVV